MEETRMQMLGQYRKGLYDAYVAAKWLFGEGNPIADELLKQVMEADIQYNQEYRTQCIEVVKEVSEAMHNAD